MLIHNIPSCLQIYNLPINLSIQFKKSDKSVANTMHVNSRYDGLANTSEVSIQIPEFVLKDMKNKTLAELQ